MLLCFALPSCKYAWWLRLTGADIEKQPQRLQGKGRNLESRKPSWDMPFLQKIDSEFTTDKDKMFTLCNIIASLHSQPFANSWMKSALHC